MTIKKDIISNAIKWWFENIFKQKISSVDDYLNSRNKWLTLQGIGGVVRNGDLLETIPLNIRTVSDEFWFFTEEEEILFVLRWKYN